MKSATSMKKVNDSAPTVKDILKRIAEINQLGTKIKQGAKGPENIEDIYEYTYKLPDLDHVSYTRFHIKCFKEGSSQLIDWGYVFTKTGYYPKSNDMYAAVMCNYCKVQLNAPIAEQRKATQLAARIHREKVYNAWIKKQILLGNM